MSGTLSPAQTWNLPATLPVSLMQPLQWLILGCKDMARAPGVSMAHGAGLVCLGSVLLALGQQRFWWLVGALSGFLVVGPLLATSLYAISRALERGEPANWALVRRTWMHWQRANKLGHDYWCLVQFGVLLALSALGWMVVSASLITLMSPVRIATPLDFLQHVVLAPDARLFTLWLALGSLLAAPIFASSVVSMPLLLDRKVTLPQAVLTSWQVIVHNPIAMAIWAGLIFGFTLLGLAPWLFGLVLVMPMLGHASWHAYRDLVDASGFALREAVP